MCCSSNIGDVAQRQSKWLLTTRLVYRDHLVSVKYGFINNIDPKIISHPANCQLLKHTNNSIKKDKSDLTLTELLNKIEKWEIKFGKNE